MYAPDIMNKLICGMDSWLARPILPLVWDGPDEPIKRPLHHAFKAQNQIGWYQFFRGRASQRAEWQKRSGTYTTNPKTWQILHTWADLNNGCKLQSKKNISLEKQRKETALEAVVVYQQETSGNVSYIRTSPYSTTLTR
jgi:hypothetical protein